MPYTPQAWSDNDVTKPVSATRMGVIETGVQTAQSTADTANTTAGSASTTATAAQTTANANATTLAAAASAATPSVLMIRDSNGRAKVVDPAAQSDIATKNYVDLLTTASSQTGSTYTFLLTDTGALVEGNSGSAQTFTVPPNSSVAFSLGTILLVRQYGAGQITVAAGAGVTLRSRGSLVKTAGQYSEISLTKRATDEWILAGDLG